MPVYIQSIATAVPETSVKQSLVRDKMKQYVGKKPITRRIIHRIYSKSGIEERHTVADDFHSNGHSPLFFRKDGVLGTPSTKTRNDLYTRHAKRLYVEIAEKLLAENPQIDKEDITHVITVSCTGFLPLNPLSKL